MITYSASLMRNLILNEASGNYLKSNYPTIVNHYLLLSSKIGPNCPNALLLLKSIWVFEEQKDKALWEKRITNNEWQ